MNTITNKLLEAIYAYKERNDGISPSLTTLGSMIGLSKTSTKYHVDRLVEEGHVDRNEDGLILTKGSWIRPE